MFLFRWFVVEENFLRRRKIIIKLPGFGAPDVSQQKPGGYQQTNTKQKDDDFHDV